MANKRISWFDRRMQQFTEISFSAQKFLCPVNIVIKAEGQQVEYYKKYITGELKLYGYGKKSDFLAAFSGLNIGKWKKRYEIRDYCFGGRCWELSIKFADGKQLRYRGENSYPENFSDLGKLLRANYAT